MLDTVVLWIKWDAIVLLSAEDVPECGVAEDVGAVVEVFASVGEIKTKVVDYSVVGHLVR